MPLVNLVRQALAAVGKSQQPNAASGPFSETLISQLLPRYSELVNQGVVYTIKTPAAGFTIVATTDINPLPAGTGVPIVGVYNPPNSGVIIIPLKVGAPTRSGTPGGPLHWNIIPAPAGITALGVNAVNNKTGITGGHLGKYFDSSTALTGSLAATYLRCAFATSAVAAGAYQGAPGDDLAGDIFCMPGAFIGLAATAVGTTHLVDAFLTCAEIPLTL